MRKLFLILIGIITLVGVGFYILNGYIRSQKLIPPTPPTPYEARLTGNYLCLPHTDSDGPQTLECAFGIKTLDDSYYALDFNQFPSGIPPTGLKMGESFTATGTVTPVEYLSSDNWKKYPIQGIFTVKSLE